jgi:hypothetical protein
MTRKEQIKAAASFSNMVSNDFIRGAEWADNHPNWRKVDEELPPPISDVPLFSNDVIVTDGRLICRGYYNYTSESWSVDGKIEIDEITHWMYLPDFPQKTD